MHLLNLFNHRQCTGNEDRYGIRCTLDGGDNYCGHNDAIFIFLLLTLVLRLRLTFNKFIYRMSQRTYYMFVGIICSMFAMVCLAAVIMVVDGLLYLFFAVYLPFLFMFLIGSALAVYFFVSNLSKLAKSRMNSMKNINISADDISLDKSQQKLVDLAARYLLLFGIATFSSMLFTVGGIFIAFGILEVLITIDFCINLFCMALQFGFAQNVYLRCCRCLDKLCRRAMSKRTRSSIHRLSIERARSDSGAGSGPSSDSGTI